MGKFDDLMANKGQKDLGTTGAKFIDADTVYSPEHGSVRLRGINAPETTKVIDGQIKRGEVGGVETTEAVHNLANELGFNNLVITEQTDATGTRKVGDLLDERGRSLSTMLAQQDITPVHTDPRHLGYHQSQEYGRWMRESGLTGDDQDIWDKARAQVDQATQDDRDMTQRFRQAQLTSGDWYQFEKARAEGRIPADQVNPYIKNKAAHEYRGRAIDTGKSLNPLSDAWDTGWLGMIEGAYGFAELAGDTTGWNWLEDVGTAGIQRSQAQIANRGWLLTDYEQIGEEDKIKAGWKKDAEGNWIKPNGARQPAFSDYLSDTLEYVGNNAAMSLPYMGLTVGSAITAPITGGLSLTAPASVYAGQTWNEMEGEKSASVAITSGILQASFDRLGIGLIFKSGGAPKDLIKKGTQELMRKGATKKEAEEAISKATRAELAAFSGDVAQVAKQQLSAGRLAKRGLSGLGAGAAGEGVTEALQESTAYLGATLGSDKEFDADELINRAQKAAVAGAVLGGTFAAPSTAYDAGAWADVAYRSAPAEAKRLSDAGKWAEDEIRQHGRVKSVRELNEETSNYIEQKGENGFASLDERIVEDKARRAGRTHGDVVAETLSAVPSLWRTSMRTTIPQHVKDQSRAARKLSDIFGGQLQRTFSGASYEAEKHHRVAIYKNMVPEPEGTFAVLNNGRRVETRKEREALSTAAYDALRAAIDPDTKRFDPNAVQAQDPAKRQALLTLQQQLETLGDKMWQDQKKHNPDLGRQHNYLLRYKGVNKFALKKNETGFVNALVDRGLSRTEATGIKDAILNNAEVNDFADAFTATTGDHKPGAHQKRSMDLAEDPAFHEFMEKDIFANMASAVKSAAKYTTRMDFVGENGEKVAALLDQMEQEGVDKDTVNKIAKGMKDIIDAESGNYNRPSSQFGKDAEKIQRNIMTWTTVAGLPLATVSSFVELALTQKGLTQDQVFGKDGKGGLSAMGRELGDTMWSGMGQIAAWSGKKRKYMPRQTEGKRMLQDLGFYEWDVGAATVTGATETPAWQQSFMETYFKAIGLSGWTNYTRAVRASMAGDFIMDNMDMIMNSDPENKTNEVQQAEESLRNIGINVQDMQSYLVAKAAGNITPELQANFDAQMREASFSFVNDAVALPGAANRPLIYQDPRFALFTQFQGFIATFTANHIPKLWGEYVKRGTPAMKYNAFAVMSTMIVLGFASQYLKDLLKYGPHGPNNQQRWNPLTGDPTTFNPHLEPSEYIQRGIRASGLLGTGERLLDQFMPLYETRSRGAGEWVYNSAVGEAPAISNLTRTAKAAGKLATGEFSEGVRQGLKAAPGVGPFSELGALLSGQSDWDFNSGGKY